MDYTDTAARNASSLHCLILQLLRGIYMSINSTSILKQIKGYSYEH